MKKLFKKKLIFITCLITIITSTIVTTFNAAQTDNTECSSIIASLENKGKDTTNMTCAEAELEYNYASTDSNSFSKNIANGFLSVDQVQNTTEKKEYYYKYFLEANLVPFASAIDDTFFGLDSFTNIVCTVITLFTNLIGLINFITTTIIMFLLSLWQTGLVTRIIDQLLVFINESILGINSTTGSGMILVASLSLGIFVRNCFIYFKNGRPAKEIVKLFFILIILIGLIPASYIQIRPMLINATNSIGDKINSTIFGTDGTDTEVELKRQVFNSMSFDGFMYKNFGVVTQGDLETRDNISSEKAKVRIEGVLNGDIDVMKKEWKTFESKFLSIDFSSALSQLVTSIIWTTHSIINMVLLAIPLLLLIILENVEQITWFFIWVPIVMMIFKMEEGYISSFFANRFQFLVMFAILNFSLVTLLRSQLIMTEIIMGYNLGLLLVIDIISLIGFYLLWSVKDSILAIFRDLFKKVPAIAWGRTTTGEIASEFKPKVVELGKMLGEKLTLSKLKVDETEMPQNKSELENDHDLEVESNGEQDIDNDDDIEVEEDEDVINGFDDENGEFTDSDIFDENEFRDEINDVDDEYDLDDISELDRNDAFDDKHYIDDINELDSNDDFDEVEEEAEADALNDVDEEYKINESYNADETNNINSIIDTYFAKENFDDGEETNEE